MMGGISSISTLGATTKALPSLCSRSRMATALVVTLVLSGNLPMVIFSVTAKRCYSI
jgi:hypothetical protein